MLISEIIWLYADAVCIKALQKTLQINRIEQKPLLIPHWGHLHNYSNNVVHIKEIDSDKKRRNKIKIFLAKSERKKKQGMWKKNCLKARGLWSWCPAHGAFLGPSLNGSVYVIFRVGCAYTVKCICMWFVDFNGFFYSSIIVILGIVIR